MALSAGKLVGTINVHEFVLGRNETNTEEQTALYMLKAVGTSSHVLTTRGGMLVKCLDNPGEPCAKFGVTTKSIRIHVPWRFTHKEEGSTSRFLFAGLNTGNKFVSLTNSVMNEAWGRAVSDHPGKLGPRLAIDFTRAGVADNSPTVFRWERREATGKHHFDDFAALAKQDGIANVFPVSMSLTHIVDTFMPDLRYIFYLPDMNLYFTEIVSLYSFVLHLKRSGGKVAGQYIEPETARWGAALPGEMSPLFHADDSLINDFFRQMLRLRPIVKPGQTRARSYSLGDGDGDENKYEKDSGSLPPKRVCMAESGTMMSQEASSMRLCMMDDDNETQPFVPMDLDTEPQHQNAASCSRSPTCDEGQYDSETTDCDTTDCEFDSVSEYFGGPVLVCEDDNMM